MDRPCIACVRLSFEDGKSAGDKVYARPAMFTVPVEAMDFFVR